MKHENTLESYSDRKLWFALLISILTVATPNEALMLMYSTDYETAKRTLALIRDDKTIQIRNQETISDDLDYIKHTCKVDGCNNPYYAKGMCDNHYREKKRIARKANPQLGICKNCDKETKIYASEMCTKCYSKKIALKKAGANYVFR